MRIIPDKRISPNYLRPPQAVICPAWSSGKADAMDLVFDRARSQAKHQQREAVDEQAEADKQADQPGTGEGPSQNENGRQQQ